MTKRRHFAIGLLLIIGYAVSGQGILPPERITLHTNADLILTGESLLFKLYCQYTDLRKSKLSKIAYVELISGEGKSVLQAKVRLDNGEGSGDFFIPSKLGSGHYTLVAYTQWMKNFDLDGFFRKEITIINPFRIQMQASYNKSQSSSPPATLPTASSDEVVVSLAKEKYSTREKVIISLKGSDSTGNVSISVHLSEKSAKSNATVSPKEIPERKGDKYLPELRGKIITGTALGADQKPVSGESIFLSVPSKNYYFHTTRSDAQGKFHFIIPYLPLPRQLIIQCAGQTNKVILDTDFLDDYSVFMPNAFNFDASLTSFIEKRSINSQIENAYYTRKQDSVLTYYPGRFYQKADKVYVLDAYTRFPTMEDILREYVVEVIVKKRGEQYELKVMDGKTRLPFSGDPLILLDGILMKDTKTVMSFDPQLLKRIEVVTKKYFLGPSTFSGIISLETFDGNGPKVYLAPEIKFEYEGLQPAKLLFAPDYGLHAVALSRIPDYRVQLTWLPAVVVNNNTKEISFYTSDVAGNYEVLVQGVTRKNGSFTIRKQFEVVLNSTSK